MDKKKKYNCIDWSQFEGMKCTDMGDTNGNALNVELDGVDDRKVTDCLGIGKEKHERISDTDRQQQSTCNNK